MEAKPWLKHYDKGVPHTLQPYPERTLLDMVSEAAHQQPDHPALFFKSTRLSYGELERLSDIFAAGLVAQGVKQGDRVALLLPNSPQAILAQFGAWKAGAIVAPLNPLYTERELEYALNECGAETIVALTPFYDKVKSLQPRTGLRRVIATNIKEYLPPFLRLLFTLLKEKKDGHRITLQPGDVWLSDLLRQHAGVARPDVVIGPSDPALFLFTGGTTGTPKGAVGTHQALLMSGMQAHAWTAALIDRDDIVVLLMPLFHLAGNGIMALSLAFGNALALVPNPSDLNDLLATIRKVRPALLPGVPTLFITLLNHPDVRAGKVDFKSLKLCISGAAPLLAETKRRFETLTGGRIVEGYSLTESMFALVNQPAQGQYKVGSVGMPLPDVEIRIVDADTGQENLAPGEIGEILMRAPQLMQGYWQRPEETANAIREGWLYTGDLGYLDEDGYLFIVDRKKDVIKPGGFQVWPREVEEIIASHPAVAEVGVAGVSDDYQGEAVKAWVVLRASQQVSADELRAYCRERLAAYKVPKYIEFRDSLPKTPIGKVLRRELVAESSQNRGGAPMLIGEKRPSPIDLSQKEGRSMTTASHSGSPHFPTVSGSLPSSTQDMMDAAVQTLRSRKEAWVALPTRERIAMIDRVITDFAAVAQRWVAASLQAKGVAPDDPAAVDEWMLPEPVLRNLQQLRQALADIEAYKRPRIPGPVTIRPDGQVVAQVFPQTIYDRLFWSGITAEVWMEPQVTAAELPKTQALAYQDKQQDGKVALVLGAGNTSAIPPMDILYKMFVEKRVVLLKPNPVNAYLGPLIEESFRALVEPGFLRVMYGGPTEGAYLCNHPGVDEIHITGSDKTFDAILFGSGREGAQRKAEGRPSLTKRVTGELGNVGPVIVVPGPWSADDLAYHAEHLVTTLTNNAGCNCLTTRVVVQHATWAQRDQLLQQMRGLLAQVPPRAAFYPGAHERHRAFVAAHPEAEQFGAPTDEQLPWTLIAGVNPGNADEVCFTTDAFCGLFAETALDAASVPEYIDQAVEFANERLWGTLNTTIIVHPGSLKDAAVAAALERAIANLRYGTVAVNLWAALGFALAATTWGAFPGQSLADIQSGKGVVHNTLMFSRPQKSVVRAPFRITPTPAWFVTRRGVGRKVFQKMTEFQASPSPWKIPGIMRSVMRG